MYSAVDISKYIISKCIKDGHPVNNYQLQKILYFIQKSYIKRGMKAFDDPIEAWQFGPVVPHAYYRFCGCGGFPIKTEYISVIEQQDRNNIDMIVDKKRELDYWELAKESRKPGGAWDIAYKRGRNSRIDDELIKSEDD